MTKNTANKRHTGTRGGGIRNAMFDKGALCFCGSHDISYDGPGKDNRPQFICGSCGSSWTNGWDGMPYSEFAKDMPDSWTIDNYGLSPDVTYVLADLI